MINVTEQIGNLNRSVAGGTREGAPTRTITISQSYDTDLPDLWDACTNAERIPRWFLPVSGDLRVGGRYQLEGNAGGVIETCEPPHRFCATWEFGETISWISVRLFAETKARTRLEIAHIVPADDDTWAQFGPGAVGIGWDMALIGLMLHTGSRAPVDRDEAAGWVASEDGRRFIALSSERWREANIAGGSSEAEAAAAATRVRDAYLGVPEH